MIPSRPHNPRHRLPRGGRLCDFCGKEPIAKLYACTNFQWQDANIFQVETGYWASCWTCAGLIDAEKWLLLRNRVMREVQKRKNLDAADVPRLRRELKELYGAFAESAVPGRVLEVKNPKYTRTMEC